MNFKFRFFSLFREIFISHHRSLEFRARILAAMICVKKTITNDDYNTIKEIAIEIYVKDAKRIGVLVQIVREYIDKIKVQKIYNIDDFLKQIDIELQKVPRYTKKIDFSHLRRLMINSDEEDGLIQQRVYEYMISEVKIYG